MNGYEFLEYAGRHYEVNSKKWSKRLGKLGLVFSEDIYQDTLLKLYDHFNEFPYTGDIEGYWYQSFLNNTKRDGKYSYHNKDESIDVLKYLDEKPYEPPKIYAELFREISKLENDIDFHLFRFYYLTDMTYKEIEDLTGVKDVRHKIKRIRELINVKSNNYRD